MLDTMNRQRGGFAIGLVAGVVIGLALALAVAVYVTKVPVPFVDKVPQRNATRDAADAEKSRNWDPNAPLLMKPLAAPAGASAAEAPASAGAGGGTTSAPTTSATTPGTTAGTTPTAAAATPGAAAASAPEGFQVQVGAYARPEDAEQHRAKLAIAGLAARISERDQAGKLVYRVRLGPFGSREEADLAREQAVSAGYGEASLVRGNR
jgi:cell division protein FtsN